MGLTQKLGTIPLAILTDASNNVGIGAAPSGSYKLEVTGTAKVSSTLLVSGASTLTGNVGIGATLSAWISTYKALQLGNTASFYAPSGEALIGNNVFVDSTDTNKYITTNFASLYRQVNGQHIFYIAASGTAGNTISFTNAFNIASSGIAAFTNRVSVGNGLSSGYFSVTNATSGISASFSDNINNTLEISHSAAGSKIDCNTNLLFSTASTERMRIQSDGLLAFGEYSSTATGYKFRFNGNGSGDVLAIVLNGGVANSTSYIAFRTGTGNGSYKADIRYETGQLSLNNISDVRFKENIIDASTSEQWDKVKNSKLRRFDFKDKTATNQLGFIAQELYQTIPEAISKGGDDEEFNGDEKSIWTLASTNMIPTMFGALQEAMTKIEELNERLNKAGL